MASGLNAGFKSIPYITLAGTFILLSTTANRTPSHNLAIVSLAPSLTLGQLAARNIVRQAADRRCRSFRSRSTPTRSIFDRSTPSSLSLVDPSRNDLPTKSTLHLCCASIPRRNVTRRDEASDESGIIFSGKSCIENLYSAANEQTTPLYASHVFPRHLHRVKDINNEKAGVTSPPPPFSRAYDNFLVFTVGRVSRGFFPWREVKTAGRNGAALGRRIRDWKRRRQHLQFPCATCIPATIPRKCSWRVNQVDFVNA